MNRGAWGVQDGDEVNWVRTPQGYLIVKQEMAALPKQSLKTERKG